MRIRPLVRYSLCALLALFFLFTSLAVAQDPDENQKIPRKDDPAAREAWFRKGRQTRNGQPSAKMLHQGYLQKMKMRAARESKLRAQMAAQTSITNAAVPTVGAWTPLGPRPIVDSTGAPNGYGPLAGRVTAVVVDQNDTTGNTVFATGAYGGVWKSTNAAASDPTTVQWTPLIDDQPTLAVGAIALQPGNSSVILIGTGEPNYAGDSYYGVGILRSTDGGATWNTISASTDGTSMYGTGVSQFAFSTKNTNVVVAGTSQATIGGFYHAQPSGGRSGIFLSNDAGATWSVVPFTNDNSQFFTATVSSVIYNPKEDKFYAVVPFLGVYVSQGTSATGFTSFHRMTNQPGGGVLALANCNITGTNTCPLYRGALSVRPVLSSGDPDQMYIWFVKNGSGNTGDDQGIWKSSTDSSGTVTWNSISVTGITNCGDSFGGCGTSQGFYNLYISAVPNGTNTDLYAGAINIYKCSLSSANPTCTATPFQNLTHVYGCNSISGVHPDQHAIDFLESNPAIVYFGNDGGVNRALTAQTNLHTGTCPSSPTQANKFDNLNTHIGSLTQFVWGTNHATDSGTLMGGSQDNGTMAIAPSLLAPGDAGWWDVNAGDGGYNWIDPVTPTNWYSAYTGVSIQYCTSGISGCNTNTFLPIVEEDLTQGSSHQVDGDVSNFYTPYVLDPAKPTQLIVGTCRVWRGGNTAASWPNSSIANALSHKLGTTFDSSCSGADDPIQAIAAGGPSNSNGSKVVYVGTSGGHVYLTTNADTGIATWTDITGSINPNGFPISGVAVDSQDPTGQTAYAVIQGFTNTIGGHVWRTEDGGANWADVSMTRTVIPDAPVNDIVIDPDTRMLYVATDIGVFTAIPGGAWSEIGYQYAPGYLPNVAVLHVATFKNGTDKRLRAWTHGRGVWETQLSAPPDLVVSTEKLQFTTVVNSSSPPQSVVLTNAGTSTITFGTANISSSSEFSILGSTCGASLAASASCSISVTFSPTVSGEALDRLYIPNNSLSESSLWVDLAGDATNNATGFAIDPGTNSTGATVTAGGTATYTFNVTSSPSGSTTFSPSLTLACTSGLPSKATCTFSNDSLSAPGAVTLSIKTTAATVASAAPLPVGRFGTGMLAAFAIPALGLLLPLGSTRARKKRFLIYFTFFVMVALVMGMGACGGGGSKTTPTPTPIPGTPTGTYSVVVTGTYGSITHTQTLTLTVQ